jgi:hypothetical protein
MIAIHLPTDMTLALFAVGGVLAGVFLLVRGFVGERAAGRIRGTSTSRISALAVGEVLVSGTAEPVELTLVSPLQSAACMYYRSRVRDSSDGDGRDLFAEDRAIGFRVRDPSGAVRVFPRGARFDVPNRFDESSGVWDGDPPGLLPRTGSAFGLAPDRESQVAALLTVRDPTNDPWARPLASNGVAALGVSASGLGATGRRRHYEEARIEPGDVVTIIGRALPFSELEDPASADVVDGAVDPGSDPEIAADLAEARRAQVLADDPADAWGNAAIEGFGIGRPVRAPVLDPDANPEPAADPTASARAVAAFTIGASDLVIAASDEVELVIALGPPSTAAARQQDRFIVGLLGAVLAIASAMALALIADGTIR